MIQTCDATGKGCMAYATGSPSARVFCGLASPPFSMERSLSMERQGTHMRRPRGRNSYTKNNVKRALAIARETPGVDHVVIETPEGTKYTFHVNKELSQGANEWDQDLYGKNPPPVRK